MSEAELAAERIRRVYARRKETIDPDIYSYFDPGHLYLSQERERALVRLLRREQRTALADQHILEVGCGSGFWLRELTKLGARPDRLWGIDLLPSRLERARALCAPQVRLACADGSCTRFADESFDIVLQSTVFSSILEAPLRRKLAAEMLRLLRPRGFVIWYDARVGHPGNPDFIGISRRELRSLFPGCTIALEPITLAPPLARRLAPLSSLACQILSKVPLLCTHYLALIFRGVTTKGDEPRDGGSTERRSAES